MKREIKRWEKYGNKRVKILQEILKIGKRVEDIKIE